MGIQGREVKQSHAVYHEAGQMVGRQTVAQPHRQFECLGVVHLFECSTHAQEYTITNRGEGLLSDKLLVGHLPCAMALGDSAIVTNRANTAREDVLRSRSRSP